MITYETDELKKSNRKNINTVKKKGRTAKVYTMNIERKRLLKQRKERTLQNAKGKGPAEEYFLTALKASCKGYKALKNSHKRKKDNNGSINDENTNITTTEAKTQDIPLEAKISVEEVKETRTHTKANIKMTAIKTIITRVIEDFIIIHIEISLKVIPTDNLEAEAVAEAEAITATMVAVGLIIKAMLIINIISIMVMMMSTRQTNMVHHVLYAVAIITLPNIVLKGSMTSMILWKR